MQRLLDQYAVIHNTERTHRALPPNTTPAQAYQARPKANPTNDPSQQFRIRHDTVDQFGKPALRYGSRIHHLGIGKNHAATPVLIVVTNTAMTVLSKTTHQLIANHTVDPNRNHWRNTQKNPGRWPGSSETNDATQV